MIIVLRSLLFNILFYGGALLLGVFLSPFLMLSRTFVVQFSVVWSRSILWLMEKIVGLRYETKGIENLPSSGTFILASKHQSAWETLALPALLKDPAFMLKKSLLWIPFFGWALRKMDMLTVDRSKNGKTLSLIRKAKEVTDHGRPLVIFPEGTRTSPGKPATYKRGLWFLYRQLHLPVIPVALNSGVFWGRRAWIKKPGTITLIFGPPLPPGLKDESAFCAWVEEQIEKPSIRLVEEHQ